MIALEPLAEFLEIVIWTGRVKGERPVSAILVADPGSGKTALLERLQSDISPLLSDLTSRTIHKTLNQFPRASHFLLGDMLSMFGHKSHVVALTMRAVSSMTGEVLKEDPFSGAQIDRQLGLITAIPPQDFDRPLIRKQIEAGGFASRFIIVRYQYKVSTIQKIHEYIRGDRYIPKNGTEKQAEQQILKLPVIDEQPVLVAIPEAIAREVQEISQRIRPASDTIGTRIHHHLRALVKAEARRNHRDRVKQCDVDKVIGYADFMVEGRDL